MNLLRWTPILWNIFLTAYQWPVYIVQYKYAHINQTSFKSTSENNVQKSLLDFIINMLKSVCKCSTGFQIVIGLD